MKCGRDDIFKPTIANESLHQDSNDNGVRIVNSATSKILVFKSTMFPHRNIHKYIWISPCGKIDYTLMDRRWHSSILDGRYCTGTNFETDDSLVVSKVREISALSKQ